MDPSNLGRHFPEILYEMVNDPMTDSIISWSPSGRSFIVWNESEFCRDVLPRFLLLRRFSLFTMMLDRFSFRKVEESDHQLEFANDSFMRGRPELTALQYYVQTTPPEFLNMVERQKKRVMELRLKEVERKTPPALLEEMERQKKRVLELRLREDTQGGGGGGSSGLGI